MREKERLRKRKKIEAEREAMKSNERLLNTVRERKRLEMQRYRAKQMEKKLQETRIAPENIKKSEAAQKALKMRKAQETKTKKREDEKREVVKNNEAVIHTQKWRLRIQMKNQAEPGMRIWASHLH